MKGCEKCKHYFGRPAKGSPCGKCITEKWGSGFERAGIRMRLKIIRHRLTLIAQR